MPNHCSNELVIRGPEDMLDAFKQVAIGLGPWTHQEMMTAPDDGVAVDRLQPYAFIPKPPISVINTPSGWYDYNISHIGTKWGAYDVEVIRRPGELAYVFSTAWSPFSNNVLIAMSRAFPRLHFKYVYDEPGAGFDGVAEFEGGVIQSEDYQEGEKYRGLIFGKPDVEEDDEAA